MNLPANLHVLILEDSAEDAEVMQRELRRAGLDFTARVAASREAFADALADFAPDLVICDYSLPAFDGAEALALVARSRPQVPVIVASGTLGDEQAVELIKAGATDYVLKDRIARLGSAARRALAERDAHGELLRFRAAVERCSDSVFIIDAASSRVVDCNAAAAADRGYSRAELTALGITALDPALDTLAKWQELVARLRTTPELRLDTHSRRKDGSVFPVEVAVAFVPAMPRPYLVAIVRDVTERQRAEQALRDHAAELERFHEMSVGRELQMIELKREVNALARRLGEPPRYDLSFLDAPAGEVVP